MTRPERRIRVLESVPQPGPQTNPYIVQLVRSLEQDVDVSWFSWRQALLGSYDVLHLHWPEFMLRRRSLPARALAAARFTALMTRTAVRGTAVVRTLHNEQPHEAGTGIERRLLAWCERRTRFWIRLNDRTAVPGRGESVVIPHGHYVDWYADHPRPEPVAGRLGYFGLIRPMKGVDELLTVFAATPGAELTLHVVGRPMSPELAALVAAAPERDPRVTVRSAYVDEPTLAAEISLCRAVVLPYRHMGNSGAVLLALSLGRPVLLPDSPATRALQAEVGEAWVRLYSGALAPDDLVAAVGAPLPAGRPDLSTREWPEIGASHSAFLASAAGVRTGRSAVTAVS